jgi:hypothetical protein
MGRAIVPVTACNSNSESSFISTGIPPLLCWRERDAGQKRQVPSAGDNRTRREC